MPVPGRRSGSWLRRPPAEVGTGTPLQAGVEYTAISRLLQSRGFGGGRSLIGLQQALPGEVFDLIAAQIAPEMFQVAPRQSGAQRAALEAHVQKVDQAKAAVGQLQDVT